MAPQFSLLSPTFFSILLLNVETVTYIVFNLNIYLACTHHFNHLVSVTAGGPEFPRSTCCQVLRSTSVDSLRFESMHPKFSVLKFIEIVILWIYYMASLLLQLLLLIFWHLFSIFKLLCLAKNHWWEFCTRNAHMVHIINEIRFKMVYISWSLFYISTISFT